MELVTPAFQNAAVLVIGDAMLDRYWHGKTARISPEAPVPVVKVAGNEDRPGGAANVALNIAALGAAASVAAIRGQDEAGDVLQGRLEAAGVACHFARAASAPTITKLRVISQQQQLLRVDFEESYQPEDLQALGDSAVQAIPGCDVLVLSDYGKGALDDPQQYIQAALEAGIPVVVDPKGQDFGKYRGATVLTPNLSEFEAVVGHCQDESVLISRGQTLRETLELGALLITRGEQGMTLLQQNRQPLHLPAQAREVFDVTGAGDTVVAVLAAALAAGSALDEAMAMANIAAGLAVARQGTASISGPELRRAVQSMHGLGRGVMSEEQLLSAVEDARASGETIVFTNGCFDIIHAGHVGYLAEAKRLGQRLIVAINADESVRRLKGNSRPINPVERRMAVLAGLEAVDWVVSFSEDTPEHLLSMLKPDILVKGGDYAPDQVVGAELVRAYGGDVKVLAFLDNCSTSAIVDKVRKSS
ncbi:bifunctional protein HldE [Pseudohongiella nitratireducens]|uniref:Bifunctional protein HldE n=1 Tax=Pseudohongiella nitratireducens TaxID=1768907 RepID=A0A917LQ09_9GAMM|nr:bifunctional D-glycero-beta-D-manno-heptose-7-phosphate kinase/D-glycero-beta-D-manno-heptose 1-phosphate adenylyltransferase HldE [Pseudohongiella nitratireducens]MDF1622142.1 bifunctional D-glycero-beta-D-manno-heptose-7-phosphate kinase/D-glycero-beta-D-manno-heptose 1-phosphate adenylyltransferase HldE [Pseudohongiella nitratireducens]GGG51095.1 bifunctional protein HldE [Pseudohongiella nitratireducens]